MTLSKLDKEKLWSKEQGTDNCVNRFTPEKEQYVPRMVERELISREKYFELKFKNFYHLTQQIMTEWLWQTRS